LKTGQYIYLEEKKKSYSGKDIYHIVREGQEMYDIAQHFGFKKNELLKLNKVYKNNKPQAGTKIRLINLNEAELSSKKCQFCQ
jgi:LysM repeat protein